MIKTLNWCYSSLRKLAADPNCPHDYKTLLKCYRDYGVLRTVWKAAALDPRFPLVEINGSKFRLSPKHFELWKAGNLENCTRWLAYANGKVEELSNSTGRVFRSPEDMPVVVVPQPSPKPPVKRKRKLRTLGKTYLNLSQLAADINCPYNYQTLQRKYREFKGNFGKIWWDSFKNLNWPKTKIQDGWWFRLSPKHRLIASELEIMAPRWYKLWVTKWHDLREFEDPKYQ